MTTKFRIDDILYHDQLKKCGYITRISDTHITFKFEINVYGVADILVFPHTHDSHLHKFTWSQADNARYYEEAGKKTWIKEEQFITTVPFKPGDYIYHTNCEQAGVVQGVDFVYSSSNLNDSKLKIKFDDDDVETVLPIYHRGFIKKMQHEFCKGDWVYHEGLRESGRVYSCDFNSVTFRVPGKDRLRKKKGLELALMYRCNPNDKNFPPARLDKERLRTVKTGTDEIFSIYAEEKEKVTRNMKETTMDKKLPFEVNDRVWNANINEAGRVCNITEHGVDIIYAQGLCQHHDNNCIFKIFKIDHDFDIGDCVYHMGFETGGRITSLDFDLTFKQPVVYIEFGSELGLRRCQAIHTIYKYDSSDVNKTPRRLDMKKEDQPCTGPDVKLFPDTEPDMKIFSDGKQIGKIQEWGSTDRKVEPCYELRVKPKFFECSAIGPEFFEGKFFNPKFTTTARFKTDDDRILEIPLPGEGWEKVTTKKCHKLAFVGRCRHLGSDTLSPYFNINTPPDKSSKHGITHEIGKIWFRDMARHLSGIHPIEITEWRRSPFASAIPTAKPYNWYCASKNKPNPDWPSGGRPRKVIYSK